jgi:hypothetical protein
MYNLSMAAGIAVLYLEEVRGSQAGMSARPIGIKKFRHLQFQSNIRIYSIREILHDLV